MDWYYVSAGERSGPVSAAGMAQLAAAGTIHADTLVWCDGMHDWVSYADATSTDNSGGTATGGPALRMCVECGGSIAPAECITFAGSTVCAACKPVFFTRVSEGSLQSARLDYAGFWPRAGAKIVDNCLIGMFNMAIVGSIVMLLPDGNPLIMLIFNVLNMVIGLSVTIAYGTYFIGRFGATPGKMILGLQVIRPDGRPITYPRALGRASAEIISGAILYIGYFIALFDEEKRSLHDFICDTRVVRV